MNRSSEFDNIKGIMIFLVVLGHAISNLYKGYSNTFLTEYLYCLIFTFHMPVFVFVSGFFSKRHTEYATYVKKAISSCLIPYLLFNILYSLPSRSAVLNFLKPNWIMWYMLSLFSWKILVEIVIRLKFPVVIAVFFSLYIGTIDSVGNYLSLLKTICFFPFFIAGYLTTTEQINKLKSKRVILIPISSLTVIAVASFYTIFKLYTEFILPNSALFLDESYVKMKQSFVQGSSVRAVLLLAGFMGIIIFLSVSLKRESLLSMLGKNSVTIYLGHGFVIKYLKLQQIITIHNPALFIIFAVFFSLLLCLVFGNNFVAKKYNSIMRKISSVVLS